jgi:hypothetical protein
MRNWESSNIRAKTTDCVGVRGVPFPPAQTLMAILTCPELYIFSDSTDSPKTISRNVTHSVTRRDVQPSYLGLYRTYILHIEITRIQTDMFVLTNVCTSTEIEPTTLCAKGKYSDHSAKSIIMIVYNDYLFPLSKYHHHLTKQTNRRESTVLRVKATIVKMQTDWNIRNRCPGPFDPEQRVNVA